jgi:glycosyltransferase involved in cell wall biosynthesis
MYEVLTDQGVRQRLREMGPARARQFSWEASARRVREIYREAACERPSA